MWSYVHNSNGKDSLDLWSCSQNEHKVGEGKGRPKASCHIYSKNRPFSAISYVTEFEILSTTTLDENHHRIFLKKSHLLQEKLIANNSPLFTMLWLACWNRLLLNCQKCTKQYFFPDHKIDTDLKISNTFHNTFPKQALKCDKYKGLFFFSWKIHF